jgi:hypothetical protein
MALYYDRQLTSQHTKSYKAKPGRKRYLYANVREGERYGRIAIEAVFLQILKDINSFYTETSEVRYERFLKNHADLQQRISQYHIASFVGVKPQSLSPIRKRIFNQI